MSADEECNFPANNSERLFILFDNVSLLFVACCLLSLLTTIVLLIFERLQLLSNPKDENDRPNDSIETEQDNQDARAEKHYVSNVALAQRMEETLTEEQKQQEYEAKREQLQAIFNLLQSNGDKFGLQTMDELEEQMKLYSK